MTVTTTSALCWVISKEGPAKSPEEFTLLVLLASEVDPEGVVEVSNWRGLFHHGQMTVYQAENALAALSARGAIKQVAQNKLRLNIQGE